VPTDVERSFVYSPDLQLCCPSLKELKRIVQNLSNVLQTSVRIIFIVYTEYTMSVLSKLSILMTMIKLDSMCFIVLCGIVKPMSSRGQYSPGNSFLL
jgi:predicted aconitase